MKFLVLKLVNFFQKMFETGQIIFYEFTKNLLISLIIFSCIYSQEYRWLSSDYCTGNGKLETIVFWYEID